MQGAKRSRALQIWKAVPMKSTANSCPLSFWVMLALSIGMGVSCKRCTVFVLLMHISLHQLQRCRGCGRSRRTTLNSFRAFRCMSPCQRQCRLCRMRRWVVLNTVSSRGMLQEQNVCPALFRMATDFSCTLECGRILLGIFCEAIGGPAKRVRIKAHFACGVATQMASAAKVCTARKITAIAVSRTIGYG